jgi:hypothetical protein
MELFSGAIASNIYRTQDKPRYIVGRTQSSHRRLLSDHASLTDGCELMFVGIGLICLPIAVIAYTRINARRDETARLAAERGEKPLYTVSELRKMGDRAPDFRYTI